MQQFKIIPAIATSWVYLFAANTLLGKYNDYKNELLKSTTPGSNVFEILEDIHGIAAGCKAVSTWAG
jgi:hypothetical protein